MVSNSFINRFYGTHSAKVIESYYHFPLDVHQSIKYKEKLK